MSGTAKDVTREQNGQTWPTSTCLHRNNRKTAHWHAKTFYLNGPIIKVSINFFIISYFNKHRKQYLFMKCKNLI